MARRLLVALLVVGCGGPDYFERVEAPDGAARPLQLSGNSRFELWTVLDGGATAEIAYTPDGWLRIPIEQMRGDRPIQIAADNRQRAWVTGTGFDDQPVLVSVTFPTGVALVVDHSAVFPAGTTEVTLHSGGIDPDPMITARVPGSIDLGVFVLRETFDSAVWARHPMSNVRELVGIYGSTGAYFATTRGAAPDALAYCQLPDDSAHCFDVQLPADLAGLDGIFASTPTSTNDWLWRANPDGGTFVRRIGNTFETHHIEGWPSSLSPVRFFALESGELGVLALRSGSPYWLTLDAQLRVHHETELGDCHCDFDPERLVMLPDGRLAIPSPDDDAWYLLDPPGF